MSSRHTPTTHDVREAWLTAEYEERDPAFTSDDDIRGEFDRWLAAHDAEVRAGVVAEETEWEYGTEYEIDANESVFTATHSEEMARKWVAESPHDTGLVRRRKAGPWEPVKN